MSDSRESPDTVADLKAAIGNNAVSVDPADLDVTSRDLFFAGETPVAVVRPGAVTDLVTAVRCLAGKGIAMVPRGGGMSYSRGYLAAGRFAIIDTRKLTGILAVNTDDMTVRVEAGVTWLQLNDALAPMGLTTPFWGTGSGKFATVGATLSHHALNYGSGDSGPSGNSVVSMAVVLASGEIVETVGMAPGTEPFFRHYGPDLTGLFLGDCGALGIKAEVTLRMIDKAKHVRYAAWEIASSEVFVHALSSLGRTRLFAECFGFDPAFLRLRTTYDGVQSGLKTIGDLLSGQSSPGAAVKAATSVAMAGTGFLDDLDYSIHVTVEGHSAQHATAKLNQVSNLLGPHGTEIEPSVPMVMRSNPFPDPTILVGRDGKLWVPVHGIVPHSKLSATIESLHRVFGACQDVMTRHAIDWGLTFVPAGESGVLIEPNLYWPDQHTATLQNYLSEDYLARRPTHAENTPARDAVAAIRQNLVACFRTHGATYFQIGRYYPYLENQSPAASALIAAIKAHLDPMGLMNPGVLGLDPASTTEHP